MSDGSSPSSPGESTFTRRESNTSVSDYEGSSAGSSAGRRGDLKRRRRKRPDRENSLNTLYSFPAIEERSTMALQTAPAKDRQNFDKQVDLTLPPNPDGTSEDYDGASNPDLDDLSGSGTLTPTAYSRPSSRVRPRRPYTLDDPPSSPEEPPLRRSRQSSLSLGLGGGRFTSFLSSLNLSPSPGSKPVHSRGSTLTRNHQVGRPPMRRGWASVGSESVGSTPDSRMHSRANSQARLPISGMLSPVGPLSLSMANSPALPPQIDTFDAHGEFLASEPLSTIDTDLDMQRKDGADDEDS